MKRSTILMIIVLAVAILVPVIFIGVMTTKLPSVGDVVNKVFKSTDNSTYTYNMKITSTDRSTVPDCYVLVTTYSGAVDTLASVNFVDPAMGVDAVLEGDSIIVNLNNVSELTADGLCLTIELPEKSRLLIENSVPTTDVHIVAANIKALKINSLSDFLASATNFGAFLSSDTTHTGKMEFENCNVGALKMNGAQNSLGVTNSNVGALSISGTCNAIQMTGSSIGVCSWNKNNSDLAHIKDCSIVSKVDEEVVAITIEDNVDNVDTGSEIVNVSPTGVVVESDDDKVNISPSGVFVESDDEKVNISPAGVFVDSDDTKVSISPAGVVVKEDGKEVVNIGIGGVKVK